ncbi:MAG TPA: AAA family ATPase [Planctomycetota bacterium]|jgi:AraC-like DNA-binding protein|nr:AAA family ATPase [Planctomycetota bacterium]
MEEFLNMLFAEAVAEDRRLCVFTLPDRRTRHFSSLTAAALHAAEEAKTKEVYFGVGLAGRNFGRRNSSSDIVAIVGLWADIDLAAPWRAEKPLPRTVDEARTILDRLPLAPSVLVGSGHGLHAYWLFKEPWVFETDDERIEAAKTARGWVQAVRNAARGLGWDVDSVGDLARVLRLPGTVNRKGQMPVEVRVLESGDRRYNPDDFEPFAADEVPAEMDEVQVDALALRPDAEPPADKFGRLMCVSQTFSDSWNHWRADFSDQSQSAYDQSLADIAALSGWSDQEIADLLIAVRRRHGQKPEKALRPDYVTKTIALARRGVQERSAGGVNLSALVPQPTHPPAAAIDARPSISAPKSLRQLVELYPTLRKPVIEGLLREGETMNVISAPKIGKSWLVIDLALAVATGRPWLGMDCVPGEVLILDNELHGETSANRIPKVAEVRGIGMEAVADRLYVENLRGRLQDLFALGPYFRQFAPGRFKVVILDAFYRFLPMRADENDNGTMASLYNYLDSFADYLKCCFVLIHHTSKGNQSLKELTDVGAGAGAQSRATDTHLILRRHEEEDAVVMEAAVRSWPPLPPRCLRWAWPVWMPADDLDPAALRKEGGKRSAKSGDDEEKPPSYDAAGFTKRFLGQEPKSQARILEEAEAEGISSRRVKRLLDLAEEEGLAFRWTIGHRKTLVYATVGPSEDSPQNSRYLVQAALREHPELSTKDVAERCGVSPRYVRRIRDELEPCE